MFTTYHQYKGNRFLIMNGLNQAYTVFFPGKPNMKTYGKTLVEAFFNACSLVDSYLRTQKH